MNREIQQNNYNHEEIEISESWHMKMEVIYFILIVTIEETCVKSSRSNGPFVRM